MFKTITKLFCALLLAAALPGLAQLPDTPQPQPQPHFTTWEAYKGHSATFWTYRGHPDKEPALRTNRQEFSSKLFLASCGALWAAVVTDVTYTHGTRENAASEYPAAAGACGLMYIGDRFFTRSFMVAPAVYCIQHYVRDAWRGK